MSILYFEYFDEYLLLKLRMNLFFSESFTKHYTLHVAANGGISLFFMAE